MVDPSVGPPKANIELAGTDHRNGVSFDHQDGSARWLDRVRRDRRIRRRRSARCEKRGVRSNQGCGVAKLGADGPARRSSSVSRAWWTGPPPIRSPRATTGHDRMTRPPRRSPPQEAARGFWIRAWGQREPALRGTGRSNDPARWPGLLEGGLDIPSTHAKCQLTSHRTPDPDVDAPRFGHCVGRIGIFVSHAIAVSLNDDRLPVMHQPVDQGRGQGVVHVKQGAPFPEGSIRGQHDRSGLHNGQRPPGTTDRPRACRSADSPAHRGGE